MPLVVTGGTTVNVYCGSSAAEGAYSTLIVSGNASAASDTETIVALYSVPADTTIYLSDIFCTGNADAEFKIYKDTTLIAEGRTSSAQRTFKHAWSRPYRLQSGEILKITVTHHESAVEDFVVYAFGSVST